MNKILVLITMFMFATFMVLPLSVNAQVTQEQAECGASGTLPAVNANDVPACQSVDVGALGFKIPSLADILTFAIRAFFAIAGIAALFYMLIGAFGWVTSGGDKDSITAARERIQAAVVGMILIVAVLAIIWTLEQVIFKRRVCLGLSCPVTLPGLIETGDGQRYCCACIIQTGENAGKLSGKVANAYYGKCDMEGNVQPI